MRVWAARNRCIVLTDWPLKQSGRKDYAGKSSLHCLAEGDDSIGATDVRDIARGRRAGG